MSSRITKIAYLNEAGLWAAAQRAEGLTLALCHGVFDLLHPCHLTQLDEARSLSDRLVVPVTSDNYVNKGPARPLKEFHVSDSRIVNTSLELLGKVERVRSELPIDQPKGFDFGPF